jgi:thiol-disulfide isomerase/thioredoxin
MKKGIIPLFAHLVFVMLLSTFLYGISPASLAHCAPSPCEAFGILRMKDKKEAPVFSLKGLDGNTTALNGLRGRPVLLFFWGSWCAACKEDMPSLQKLAEGKQDQLTVFTIACDGEREKRIQKIVKDLKLNLPVLLVYKEKVLKDYSVNAIPMAILIDQEGFWTGKIVGQRDWSSAEAWFALKELFGLR